MSQTMRSLSGWKVCPDNVDKNYKYNIDSRRLIATKKIDYSTHNHCTIIGNAPLLPNKINSWSIKILESKENNGNGIYIGIAPFDIDQNSTLNRNKCGWYIHCFASMLFSGPPHYYDGKAYGYGKYIHKEDTVGVIMDTVKGDLSFSLNGVNFGVAYESIPLDRPLVPCVLLEKGRDSVELDLSSEMKESVNDTIPVPSTITATSTSFDSITLTWDKVAGAECHQVKADENKSIYSVKSNSITVEKLLPGTVYNFRVRSIIGNTVSVWSDPVNVITMEAPDFSECVWKNCTDSTKERSEDFNIENPRIASCTDCCGCNFLGNVPLPLNKVVSWHIKILQSYCSNESGMRIGVSLFNLKKEEFGKLNIPGWYLDCKESVLCSGPPHNYMNKEYGPRKVGEKGNYFIKDDVISVVMNTAKGDLSFFVNGVNYGVAFEGIPLDKPLAPYVFLSGEVDIVELDTFSEVKENVDSSIPVPYNLVANSNTWDSITVKWDPVDNAKFYQIEIGECKLLYVSTTNIFSKGDLQPESEYRLRVRTVMGRSVSEWSDAINVCTSKKIFDYSRWKGCPVYINDNAKFVLGGNNGRIATKIGSSEDWSTIIGNTIIPLNVMASWSIKILRSQYNEGEDIYIGVALFDTNQNGGYNSFKCGWYFNCHDSTLCSGPPHLYYEKEYGPRYGPGEYVHTGNSVGVMLSTTRGELSFIVNGVCYGTAYEKIPLDKPLVPCVLIKNKGDSVEYDPYSEVMETLGKGFSFPSNVVAKSNTWDSITIRWSPVAGAQFYQFAFNNKILSDTTSNNEYTVTGLNMMTEYDIRVRAAKYNQVGAWSNAVKEYTQKPCFEECIWKECPSDVYSGRAYLIDKKNPRIVTKKIMGVNHYTIIGDTVFHINTTTSFGIRILKTFGGGDDIYVGVAPFNIKLDEMDNFKKCGWYFDCYYSKLCSGPPHNYDGKEYGPRKGSGEYVHKKDTVGVIMDTTKGELSFVVKGVNLGIAYGGIPLDKPLVPCIILGNQGDSVELIIGGNGNGNEGGYEKKEDCVIS